MPYSLSSRAHTSTELVPTESSLISRSTMSRRLAFSGVRQSCLRGTSERHEAPSSRLQYRWTVECRQPNMWARSRWEYFCRVSGSAKSPDEAYCFGRKRALPTTVRQACGPLLLLRRSTALGVGGLKGRHGRWHGICGGQNFDPTLWHVRLACLKNTQFFMEDLLEICSKTCLIPPTDTGT
mgnify:CR=1 FL=1